jgi:multidrug efflux system outer membrane protein
VATVVLLSSCSLVPVEKRPPLDVPGQFVELRNPTLAQDAPLEALGRWKPAEPGDTQPPSPWWSAFGDAVLVQLEKDALRANPDVAIAMARLQQARALTRSRASERVPDVDVSFGPTRQRTSGAADGKGDGVPGTTQTLWRAQAQVAYEVDIFGRVSSGLAAARGDEAQQQALAHQLLLLVQTDVATTYFSLRQLEEERRLLSETVSLREKALTLIEHKLSFGAVPQALADQAETELFATRADQLAMEQQYAVTSHALAVLLGKSPEAFSLKARQLESVDIRLPVGMPSALLERRPDIAAAERAMAAENARIGVARAAFFPSLSLTAAFGHESAELSNLGNWSQRTFLLGPLVGTMLNLPIFDGGRRKADVTRAHARYEESVAEYRKKVLQAFREVEDALVSMRTLDERIADLRRAQKASSRVAHAANARFDEGDVDYLVVVDAERTLLRSRQSLIQSEGERARVTVDLVRALGGGWDAPDIHGASAAR